MAELHGKQPLQGHMIQTIQTEEHGGVAGAKVALRGLMQGGHGSPLSSLMTLLARLCPSSLNHLRRAGSMASMAFMPFTSMPIPAPIGR